VQLCIVPLVQAALRYAADKDSRGVATGLKSIYQAATVFEAEQMLDQFEAKYPTAVKPWRLKWPDITAKFEFPRRSARRSTRPTRSSRSTA
jgi:transposase-like protein